MHRPYRAIFLGIVVLAAMAGLTLEVLFLMRPQVDAVEDKLAPRAFQPHQLALKGMDSSGFFEVVNKIKPWPPDASLQEIAAVWVKPGYRQMEIVDQDLTKPNLADKTRIHLLVKKATLFNYEGEPAKAYACLEQARSLAEAEDEFAKEWLYTIIYMQGITGLRRGEDENCIMCRGESSCIFPINAAAVHTKPLGSQFAIKHFSEYLEQFPDDLSVRWLLNLAHMTLGEHPGKVDRRYLLNFDHFTKSECNIGHFRDIGHLVGVNRLNQSGTGIMEDFDNDGHLDLVLTCADPTQPLAYYRNQGNGTFADQSQAAGVTQQLGGLFGIQTDFNNDGFMDIFVVRGAWHRYPMRPSLLRNNGNGTFTDVTKEAGLLDPVNSISASWADYDNDGFLDLFICCDKQANRLYHNKGNGTFEEVAAKAGVQGDKRVCKGSAWIDYDNDGWLDLYLSNHAGPPQLFRNNRTGTFTDVTRAMGIDGPSSLGFSCWAFDYDNDGYLDLFSTCYDCYLPDAVRGLMGQPHEGFTSKLYRNLKGSGFQDVTKEAGVDQLYQTMGSNFGDFDNDGFLDFYLGTGAPDLAMLVPNRMFKNMGGKRFADITASSGTGQLQKGHGVACADWDRNGTIDLFMVMGGAINGDKYHNILFQNPGQGNNWLTVKLVGKKTNRAAIGARIKAVTAGATPLTVHRHVSTGSSFGANPLQQTLGLAKADKIALLEINWPTSGTTQVFRDVAVNQAIEITEFANEYRKLNWTPIPPPR